MGFVDTVQYLYDLQKFGTKLGLDNTRRLLDILGRPDAGRRYLHVTGTNGKGSVSAMAASALTRAGHRTGLYTSPHLVSFTERMRVDGVEATQDEVVALAERLKGLLAAHEPGMKPTFFEFTTAMAFEFFAEKGADPVVLEVGMGGRLDSTNVVTPMCSVITNVEMEHAEYLGGTIMDIAREKAGIVKPGVPLVSAEAKPEVIGYLRSVCAENGSAMHLLGSEFGWSNASLSWRGARGACVVQRFDYEGPGGPLEGVELPAAGPHQLDNAATALCALGLMSGAGLAVTGEAARAGLAGMSWPGRLEVVSERPLMVLDGAHNPASARALAEAVRAQFNGRYRRLVLVLGALADKEFGPMYDALGPIADAVVFTKAEYSRAAPPEGLAAMTLGRAGEVFVTQGVAEAVAKARAIVGPDDMVLVTGSLYVVGEAKAALAGKEMFLKA